MNPDAPHVGWAVPSDVEPIAAILRAGSAWMAAKGCPAWTAEMTSAATVSAAIARTEFLIARVAGEVVGVCTLARADPTFWPEDSVGDAAYLHRLAVRRDFAGGRITPGLVAACIGQARAWGLPALKLDCHPMLRGIYERLGFTYVDTRQVNEGGLHLTVNRLRRIV